MTGRPSAWTDDEQRAASAQEVEQAAPGKAEQAEQGKRGGKSAGRRPVAPSQPSPRARTSFSGSFNFLNEVRHELRQRCLATDQMVAFTTVTAITTIVLTVLRLRTRHRLQGSDTVCLLRKRPMNETHRRPTEETSAETRSRIPPCPLPSRPQKSSQPPPPKNLMRKNLPREEPSNGEAAEAESATEQAAGEETVVEDVEEPAPAEPAAVEPAGEEPAGEEPAKAEAPEAESVETAKAEAAVMVEDEAEAEAEPFTPIPEPALPVRLTSRAIGTSSTRTPATRTRSRRISKLASHSMHLEDRSSRSSSRWKTSSRSRTARRSPSRKKVFPGYILCRMYLSDDSWYAVRNTPGVTGFVGSGNKPVPLSRREVETYPRRQKEEEAGKAPPLPARLGDWADGARSSTVPSPISTV